MVRSLQPVAASERKALTCRDPLGRGVREGRSGPTAITPQSQRGALAQFAEEGQAALDAGFPAPSLSRDYGRALDDRAHAIYTALMLKSQREFDFSQRT